MFLIPTYFVLHLFAKQTYICYYCIRNNHNFMKNEIIVALVEKGVGTTTSLTLDSKDAYVHYKFKKWLDKNYSSIVESQREMLNEIGIEDTGAYVKRIQELMANESMTK